MLCKSYLQKHNVIFTNHNVVDRERVVVLGHEYKTKGESEER
jgi:hypothetical protein